MTTITLPRRVLAVVLCCAAVAWLAGPVGRLLVVLPLFLFGPGYLLDHALPTRIAPTAFLRPALWLGLSLSIVALVYEWTTVLGLTLTPPVLGALAALCGLGVIWNVWGGSAAGGLMVGTGHRVQDDTGIAPGLQAPVPWRWWAAGGGWSVALLAIFVLTQWVRFVQIKDLALPSWVDSVHHALMIRIAAERGQAPYSLRPYMPVDQLPYHWGYHVFVAAVLRLSGLPLGQTILWVGQVLSALHVLTVAALAAYLWRRPLAGIVAGIVVGLLSIMPAYYVSWGRYTQLMGLLILPPLAIVWHAGLRAPSRRWQIYTATLLAGMSLIHFRVLVFALSFMGVIAAVWAIKEGSVLLRARLWHGALSAGLALALAAPWLWSLGARMLLPTVERPQSLVGEAGYNRLNEGLLWAGQNRLLVALALAAALYGLLRRSTTAVEQLGWVGVLSMLANPWLAGYVLPAVGAVLVVWGAQWRRILLVLGGAVLLLLSSAFLHLPYLWLITNDAVVISLFIPIAVLIGGGICMLAAWLENRSIMNDGRSAVNGQRLGRAFVRYGGVAALGLLALWGARDLQGANSGVVNSGTILATRADVAAIEWVVENTPADARFLINAGPWLPGVYRGTDGGWWLLPLAGRWTSTPPVLYTYGSPSYVREIMEINTTVAGFRSGQEQQLYQLIDKERITYIYLGPRPVPLSPAIFAGNSAVEKVYARDGVTILAVHRQP